MQTRATAFRAWIAQRLISATTLVTSRRFSANSVASTRTPSRPTARWCALLLRPISSLFVVVVFAWLRCWRPWLSHLQCLFARLLRKLCRPFHLLELPAWVLPAAARAVSMRQLLGWTISQRCIWHGLPCLWQRSHLEQQRCRGLLAVSERHTAKRNAQRVCPLFARFVRCVSCHACVCLVRSRHVCIVTRKHNLHQLREGKRQRGYWSQRVQRLPDLAIHGCVLLLRSVCDQLLQTQPVAFLVSTVQLPTSATPAVNQRRHLVNLGDSTRTSAKRPASLAATALHRLVDRSNANSVCKANTHL